MIDAGFLNQDGTAKLGMNYLYDDCSQSVFAYDKSKNVLVSYDDAKSIGTCLG